MTNENLEQQPEISVNAQYIKDFSFENPNAPESLIALETPPKIELAVDINVQRLQENNTYEVALNVEAKALNTENNATIFMVDLEYAGIFSLNNIPTDQRHFILGVHCPALIFPFVRQIISNITQDGGFQPLMIDPINFVALYNKKMQEAAEDENAGNA